MPRSRAACRDAGLTFIGPSPEAIALMGSKTAARRMAIRAGVPVVPGTERPFDATAPSDQEILRRQARIGYPLVVKAVAGGGGKGMRVVERAADLLPVRFAPRGRRPAPRSATRACTSSAG